MEWRHIVGVGLLTLSTVHGAWAASPEASDLPEHIGFNRHVRPILSDKCYACHGPDSHARKGDLRLDLPPAEGVESKAAQVISAGDPETSELVHRIFTTDADDQMPPVDQKKQLTEGEKAILKAWVEQGAAYEPHWAYIPPAPHAAPAGDGSTAPIDGFVQAVLVRNGLSAQPEADRRTLMRRLHWDILGVPPTPADVEAFVADQSPTAYEALVDRLLASPHYGERMAMDWLDAVRYADSNGYHSDEFRSISAFRDYVINAFNTNMPFDQFTREQLAGDLLPEPTREQLIASGYNRLNQITAEGGAQAKEYIAKYAADRVRTTATVWMGATMGCAECHDHKFDPLSTRDFYEFSAFFADIEEKGVYGSGQKWDPFMYLPTPEEATRETELLAAIQGLETTLKTVTPELDAARAAWEEEVLKQRKDSESLWKLATPTETTSQGETVFAAIDGDRIIARGPEKAQDIYTLHVPTEDGVVRALMLETFNHPELDGVSRGGGNFVLTQFVASYRAPGAETSTAIPVVSAQADYSQAEYPVTNALNDDKRQGWAVDGHLTKGDHVAIFGFGAPVATAAGGQIEVALHFESQFAAHQIDCFRLKQTGNEVAATTPWLTLPPALQTTLRTGAGFRTPAERAELADFFLATTPALQPQRDALVARRNEFDALKAGMETTLIAKSLPEPRITRVLPRGNWLDESGEEVLPDTPEVLPDLGVTDRRANRLDLANWLVRKDNPLTARVTMNRLWKQFYGIGISKVLDDLGAQGEWPTHPELLDWLAREFVDSGWDVKHMVRLMVTSKTYRESSMPTETLRAQDPFNRLYARQSRYRIEAELVRDGALAISGLLAPDIGGRSVFPYQPEGYYANCNTFGGVLAYDTDTGSDQYRRGLYTFWKRSFLHPSLLAFDAPSREECTAERTTSNTPLQALVLLNDPTYVEAARVFAQRIMAEGGERSDDRIILAYHYALSREPDAQELELIRNLYHSHLMEYSQDPEAAKAVLEAGMTPVPEGVDVADLAAWTSVTRVILNLHETITRS